MDNHLDSLFGMLMNEERMYDEVDICMAIQVQCDVVLDDPNEMKAEGFTDDSIRKYIQNKLDLIKRIEEQIDIAKSNIEAVFGVEVTTENE